MKALHPGPRIPSTVSPCTNGNSYLLREPTLVLNKSWIPIRICTSRRALVLLFKDLACVIGENYVLHDFSSWISLGVANGEPHVRTVSLRIRLPEIIVLRTCDRFMQPRVVFSRRNIFRRDLSTCQYCGRRGPAGAMSIDHILPRSLGGNASWTNCVVACRSCNERKGNRPLSQTGMKLRRQPNEPSPHMAFTLHVGGRKRSWEQFVGDGFAAAAGGSQG